MGSKKRSINSVEEVVEGQTDLAADNTVSMPSDKKSKMFIKTDAQMGDGVAAPSSVPSSIKPMERKKEEKTIRQGETAFSFGK